MGQSTSSCGSGSGASSASKDPLPPAPATSLKYLGDEFIALETTTLEAKYNQSVLEAEARIAAQYEDRLAQAEAINSEQIEKLMAQISSLSTSNDTLRHEAERHEKEIDELRESLDLAYDAREELEEEHDATIEELKSTAEQLQRAKAEYCALERYFDDELDVYAKVNLEFACRNVKDKERKRQLVVANQALRKELLDVVLAVGERRRQREGSTAAGPA